MLGDQEFNEIVIQFQRFVFRLAFSVVRNMEDADDITQEVFVKLYTHRDRIEKPEAIKAWLARTAVSTARDRLRWMKVRKWLTGTTTSADEISSNSNSPDVLTAAKERKKIVDQWTSANLSPKERVVFQLHYGEEMTTAEISETLAMNQNTVKTYLHRAQKKIKESAEVSKC